VGTLSHSGKVRAVFAGGEGQAHLVEVLDGVLRRLGGTARRWRVDRMATVCNQATGRLLPSFAAVARYYGVSVDVCPARRANRKGAVESRNHFLTQLFWRTLQAKSLAEAQSKLDRFSERVGDRRRHVRATVGELAAGERLLPLPALPYPATLELERVVSAVTTARFGSAELRFDHDAGPAAAVAQLVDGRWALLAASRVGGREVRADVRSLSRFALLEPIRASERAPQDVRYPPVRRIVGSSRLPDKTLATRHYYVRGGRR